MNRLASTLTLLLILASAAIFAWRVPQQPEPHLSPLIEVPMPIPPPPTPPPRPGGSAEPPTCCSGVLVHRTCSSAALLVTDRSEMALIDDALCADSCCLVSDCGTGWAIRDVDFSGLAAYPIQRSERCARETGPFLLTLFRRASATPTGYLLTLTIPSTMSPEQVGAALSGEGHVFFFTDPTERLSRATISGSSERPIPADRSEWDAASKANDAAAQSLLDAAAGVIASTMPVHSFSTGHHDRRTSSFGAGRIAATYEKTVFFMPGQPVGAPPPLPHGTTISQPDLRSSTYPAVLLTPNRMGQPAQRQLIRRYPFLISATDFAHGCRPSLENRPNPAA